MKDAPDCRRRPERGFSVGDWMSTKNRQQIKDFNTKLRALDIVGNGFIRCAWCGDTRIEVLHLDHIKGDGHRHRRQMGKGGKGAEMRAWRDIIRHPELARRTYQLLFKLSSTEGCISNYASRIRGAGVAVLPKGE